MERKEAGRLHHGERSQKAHLIYFGLAGHGVELSEQREDSRSISHISGYDSPESFERCLVSERRSIYPALAHVPVLDKRPALKKHPGYAYSSPLVDVRLSDGEVDRINKESALEMLPGLSGGFDTLAALAIAHKGKEPGPLDSVSVQDYIQWWTSRGARLGRMDSSGLRIIWNEREGAE